MFMMSANNSEAADEVPCAACGIAQVNDIKFQKCAACELVRYCSVKCQKDHRPRHKRDCKRRVAELRDKILFQQPESRHDGDCPICCLPLPINKGKSMMMCCCSKTICNGCDYSNTIREMKESLDLRCPFCRELIPSTQAEVDRHRMKRIEVNDPVALRQMGNRRCRGEDFRSGFEYFSKAAELGDAEAHYHLSFMYRGGQCVEMDKKKELHHLEEAAILGHTVARYTLGCVESKNVKMNDPINGCLSAVRAAKHWIIAAKLGDDKSVGLLKWDFQMGLISKEDYATALRAHQDAVNATKSPQREAAEAIYREENVRSSSGDLG